MEVWLAQALAGLLEQCEVVELLKAENVCLNEGA